MTTVSQINKALKLQSIDGRIIRGKGYYYFIGELMDKIPSIFANDLRAYDTETVISEILNVLGKKETRGGKRKGAGRKKGKKTTVISFRVPVDNKDNIKNNISLGINQAIDKQVYSLCEAVADIAFLAGENKYYSGNSRQDMADFIEWAKEFEKINQGIEWGVNSDKDYIDAIEEFAALKMGL